MQAGKDAWQVVGPEGEILRENNYGEGAVLSLAQTLAQKCYDENVTLVVRLKAVLGPPDELFRVVREEDGSISTHRVPV